MTFYIITSINNDQLTYYKVHKGHVGAKIMTDVEDHTSELPQVMPIITVNGMNEHK